MDEFGESNIFLNNNDPYYFIFVADCRSRLKFPIPVNYFENCLSICYVPVKRKEPLGENGMFEAMIHNATIFFSLRSCLKYCIRTLYYIN
ncbi:Chloramphenicol acetyltransferase-like domain containing protein [Trema orientale]|uniref:Chloramphenicol acetyltransferase-like domain containing protein n=1 Tax=Trema orientale TaxID=63057 RepID=A0A2P5ESW9_TREOI|nr:Chloramphenicol acetyltransferase-like domain containing protein [Trema orientale]